MATLAENGLTLAEHAKRHDPNGNLATIINSLAKENIILQEAPFMEANDTFANTTTRHSKLPAGAWRKLNRGVSSEKSHTIQVTDVIGLLESWSKNDVKLIDSFRNPAQARNDEDMSFVEGMGQTIATAIFYSNTSTTPEKFTGLAPRMASIAVADNVINEGGTGSDLTSIYVVTWGRTECNMLFPQNSMAGLQMEDMGKQIVQDSSSLDFLAYVSHFTWDVGLAVKNEKCIGRLANIESTGSSNIFDEDNLITLLNRLKTHSGTRIYCNKTVMTQMEIAIKDKANVNYSHGDGVGLAPGPVLRFKGYPVQLCEAIVNTEAALT